MKTLMHAKSKQPVDTGEVLRDGRGRRYYLRGVHNNKVLVTSMDEQKLLVTAKPEVFNCFLIN
jgi:hypothetical protein|tara:strand:- start:2060 stop:2248 length:189 start_codon:yes stop_codon:yes gene_type:complete